MQAAQGQKQEVDAVARRRGSSGATAAADGGRAEFRGLFVSLVDPAGLLDMERCGEIAARMGEAASGSGYRAGARMASSWQTSLPTRPISCTGRSRTGRCTRP